MNLTVTTQGRQFDRLGIMYLGGVEVFRTSTAEPTPRGIVWTYVKEMQQYNTLWNDSQEIIFALPNIVNNVYTGPLTTTLTATFFTVPDSPPTADQILPIAGNPSGTWGPAFQVPDGGPASVKVELPKNIERAVVSLSACGQQAEEFWYTNVFNKDTKTFSESAGDLSGYSPFREVQLLIDGQLAGVSWPFPVVFTGGIVPGFWRPIVGIDAFDLRQAEIDISPWLPLLCDGTSHIFEIRVVGLDDDNELSNTVESFWLVTGTIFVFLDGAGSITTGSSTRKSIPAPQISTSSFVTRDSTGANDTLSYSTIVQRYLAISSTMTTSSGTRPISWTQNLSYSNYNLFTHHGVTQYTTQTTAGTDHALPISYQNDYRYPVTVNSTFQANPNQTSISGTISHGLYYTISGPSIFPSGIQSTDSNKTSPTIFNGIKFSTTQNASGAYLSTRTSNTSYSFGSTSQVLDFSGSEADTGREIELYHRQVTAVNSSVVEDEAENSGVKVAVPVMIGPESMDLFVSGEVGSVRSVLGRGPGGYGE